jgi:RNA polymerase sigma-70 factor (sigma-E family)
VKAASGVDPAAAAYVADAAPRLIGLAVALTGNRYDAEDLVQEALATVMVKWRVARRATNLDAYVRRVMINQHATRRRRRSAGEVVSGSMSQTYAAGDAGTGVADGDRSIARIDDRDPLLRLLWQLPRQQRVVLVLRYLEDLSDAQIAEQTGYRQGSVRALASRGLRRIRRDLPLPTSGSRPTVQVRRAPAVGRVENQCVAGGLSKA